MPPTFLSKDFLFRDTDEAPAHIEEEAGLKDHDHALWCLVAIDTATKTLRPVAINIEGANDAYALACARLNLLNHQGDTQTKQNVVSPDRFDSLAELYSTGPGLPEPGTEIDLDGEYWRTYAQMTARHEAETQELRDRHSQEVLRLHIDFQDDPDAIVYLEGMASNPEGVRMIEEARQQKEKEASQT